MATAPKWTKEEDEVLKRLTTEGYSASLIGREMGRTRNSIIGRQHRLKLNGGRPYPKRNDNSKPRPRRSVTRQNPWATVSDQVLELRRTEAKMKSAAVMKEMDRSEREPLMISLVDLEMHHCRWPIGNVGSKDFGFCGHVKFLGSSYCPYHASVATNGIPSRRDQRPEPRRKAA